MNEDQRTMNGPISIRQKDDLLRQITVGIWNAIRPYTGPNAHDETIVFVGLVLGYAHGEEPITELSLMLPSYSCAAIKASELYAAAAKQAALVEDDEAHKSSADDSHHSA